MLYSPKIKVNIVALKSMSKSKVVTKIAYLNHFDLPSACMLSSQKYEIKQITELTL